MSIFKDLDMFLILIRKYQKYTINPNPGTLQKLHKGVTRA